MRIGVDYYPEHWDRALWKQDADLMQKTGVKLVRLAEFAWCRLEPREGEFEFAWLDEVIDLFEKRDIGVVLCTPTSCPPLWLYEKYPDAVMVEKDGQPTRTGIRGHRCINHPAVIEHSRRIIEAMTKRYGRRDAVVAWQIDNELEAYFCFCERCNGKFRKWLKDKYGSLEAINRAHGNVVWSNEYSSWQQIQPPYGHYSDAWMNPAYMLDYSRFASDNVIEFSNWQAALIRENSPGKPVTTNVWFCGHMPDFYREFESLDFMAYDNYPVTRLPDDPEECFSHAFHLDMMRGVKRRPFWVMEQLSGGMGCWAPMSRTTSPGMIKGYALQAFAHGADTVLHFRWRTANIGAEMHWHGLIDHSNVPGRRFEEFADLCKTAQALEGVRGAETKADVAILISFDSEYAFKLQPQTEGYYYFEQPQRLHRAFTSLGMNVDIIGQHEVLSGYRVVCAPELYVTDPAVSRRLHAFARQGGTVILTTRSGVKDMNNNAIMAQLPTVYRDMVGAVVAEYNPIGADTVPVLFEDGAAFIGRQWCDILELEGAEAAARYDGGFCRGKAAVTRHAFGQGIVWYIGTVGQQALYDKIAFATVREAGLDYVSDLPPQVEVTTRVADGKAVRFVFNHAGIRQRFRFMGRELALDPFKMKVLMQDD